MELTVALPVTALDMVPLGVAKVDERGCITYANREMLRIAGLDDWRGQTLDHVFRADALDTVRDTLRSRFETRAASEYRVELTRKDDGRAVPVSITSFPETNGADEVIGTLALVRDLTFETAQKEMYQLVEKESHTTRLLDAIADALQPLVPYERMTVIRLNEARTHLRSIYTKDIRGVPAKTGYRWWCIPPAINGWLNCKEILVIDDILEWYEHPDRKPMLDDPVVQDYLKLGLVSSISVPVNQNGKQVASIVLHRKPGSPFTPIEQRIVDDLPLAEAVSVALRNEKEGNLNFLISLITLISSAYESVQTVAQTIVKKISEHYGWDYVSIYQVYEHLDEIRLIAEKAGDGKVLLLESQSFTMSKGIIGHVFRNKKSVNIGNIKRSEEFGGIYIPRAGIQTLSELCVPVGSETRWLLNVEDEKADAFAPEEQHDLEAIAASLSALLKRTLDYQYRSAVVERANDAIILTDAQGRILEANPATSRLLGLPRAGFEAMPIEQLFVDAKEAKALLKGGDFPNQEVMMRRNANASVAEAPQVKVLLSVATLPNETGGKIFIASDMRQTQRIQQLELAQDLYQEVTGQVKTPMSLAIAWLRRFKSHSDPGGEDVARKVIQQLQKAELTLDRMMLVERGDREQVRHEVILSVNDLLEAILLDMPERERGVVVVDRLSPGDAFVRGNAYELRYCLQTVLSYLLRLAAEDDRIALGAARVDHRIELTASGRGSALDPADIRTECRNGQVRAEIALGSSTLGRLAARNRGAFEDISVQGSNALTFRFTFPAVHMKVPS